MRDFKFRAWNKKFKIMQQVTSLVDIYHCSARAEINKTTLEEWDFDDIELLQYTGLKDKNSKYIYEGDILNYSGEKRMVNFEEGRFQTYTGFGQYTDLYLINEDCKVIGNIYENPELIGK